MRSEPQRLAAFVLALLLVAVSSSPAASQWALWCAVAGLMVTAVRE